MLTKLWIYIFTLLGTIINTVLLTYEKWGNHYYIIAFILTGGSLIFFCKNSKKGYIKFILSICLLALFICFQLYLLDNDFVNQFYEYGKSFIYYIATIIAWRNYNESIINHKKELVRCCESLLDTVSLHNLNHDDEKTIKSFIWHIEMAHARKSLEKEMLNSNWFSDFAFSEIMREFSLWKNHETRDETYRAKKIPLEHAILCKEMKLAEEIASTYDDFINSSRKEFKNKRKLRDAIIELKKHQNDDYDTYKYDIAERFSH